jgi:hypothetical protein
MSADRPSNGAATGSGGPRLTDLDLLQVRVECVRCGRWGRYRLRSLKAKHGARATVFDVLAAIRDDSDCPHRTLASGGCALIVPDLIDFHRRRVERSSPPRPPRPASYARQRADRYRQ